MGKRTSQLTQLTAAQVAQGDFLPIVDVSAGQTKYVTVKDLTGLPDTGWLATGESWSYNTYNSTTRTGIVSVPTDATTKYTKGMRVRFIQTTGGTKHAIIHDVTATALHLFIESGKTLANEPITSPVYSPLDIPLGFPKSQKSWMLEYTTSTRQSQASPTANVVYQLGGSLLVSRGTWAVEYSVNLYTALGSVGPNQAMCGLSTANNTIPSDELKASYYGVNILELAGDFFQRKIVDLSADTTFYLNATTPVTPTTMAFLNDFRPQYIRAISALL